VFTFHILAGLVLKYYHILFEWCVAVIENNINFSQKLCVPKNKDSVD